MENKKSGEIDEVLRVTKGGVYIVPTEMREAVKLRAQNAKMLAMLRRIDNPYDCIACGSVTETHRPDCELAALIKECGGE